MVEGKQQSVREGLIDQDDIDCFTIRGDDFNLISRLAIWDNLPSKLQEIRQALQMKTPELLALIEKRIKFGGGHSNKAEKKWTPDDEAKWALICSQEERSKHICLKLAHALVSSVEGAANLFLQYFSEKKQETWICVQPEKTFYTEEQAKTWEKSCKVRGDQEITLENWNTLPSCHSHGGLAGRHYREGWFDPRVQLLKTSTNNIDLWQIILEG